MWMSVSQHGDATTRPRGGYAGQQRRGESTGVRPTDGFAVSLTIFGTIFKYNNDELGSIIGKGQVFLKTVGISSQRIIASCDILNI